MHLDHVRRLPDPGLSPGSLNTNRQYHHYSKGNNTVTTTPKATGNDTKGEPAVESANKEATPKVIPAQVSSNTVEVVEVDSSLKQRAIARIKSVATNKRVVASATSVAVIAAGVLVVRRRNAAVEESTENNEG